ncbi:DUF2867 domain-containing protein [Streptacidiphilus neutrinimicus]|uniref:DUF2867 domain-containing protein n=1 Tax=Streptacidiphilus neutrinimicus TaxID=105420 RepID=UPI00069361BC|nr:DUF2867 domain-containing protein [Streptacidiphilus neutrinimicus]
MRRNVVPVAEAAIASLGGCDHVDAVAVDLAAGTTAVGFTHSVLAATPGWVHTLLSLRDAAMKPFGLQTQTRVAADQVTIEPGRHLGPLRILTVSEEEVLAGDDDKHLDFRTSFAVRTGPQGAEGVCTTVVRCHNGGGRLYFRAIRPFHNLVVPRIVARAAP